MWHHLIGKATSVQHSPELKQAAVIALCTRSVTAQAIAQEQAVCRPISKNSLLDYKKTGS